MAWQDEDSFSNYALIAHLPSDKAILVTNDITGRIWKSNLYSFDSSKDLLDNNHSHKYKENVGINSVLVWDDDLILGLDNGQIKIIETEHYDSIESLVGHDSYISALALNNDHTRLVSGSLDLSIINWDLHTFVALNTYRPAHCKNIKSLSHSFYNDTFLSCGDANEVILWDTRLAKPAKFLKNKTQECITALTWATNSEHSYILGSQTGTLFFKDLRNPETEDAFQVLDKEIHTFCFSPTESNLLAIGGYHTTVAAFDTTTKELAFKDDQHNDFVSGLSWDLKEHALYSCGWDNKVIKHLP